MPAARHGWGTVEIKCYVCELSLTAGLARDVHITSISDKIIS